MIMLSKYLQAVHPNIHGGGHNTTFVTMTCLYGGQKFGPPFLHNASWTLAENRIS